MKICLLCLRCLPTTDFPYAMLTCQRCSTTATYPYRYPNEEIRRYAKCAAKRRYRARLATARMGNGAG